MPSAALTPLQRYRADRAKYPAGAWLRERSLWAVAVYRLGQAVRERDGLVRALCYPLYGGLALLVQILTNIEIPASARIGPGLRIHHAGPIIVNAQPQLGADCILNTGVISGNKETDDAPVIGDRVSFGAGSCVLGDVRIGDDARVGAMTLVLKDVPAGATVVGIPARVLEAR